jgi:hypothetical protein
MRTSVRKEERLQQGTEQNVSAVCYYNKHALFGRDMLALCISTTLLVIHKNVKVKGKVRPATGHEDREGE